MKKIKNNLFYDLFHKNTSVSFKIISRKSFTYYLIYPILEKYLKIDRRLDVLDIGCGAGTMSFLIASWGNKVEGIDVSSKSIDSCQKSAQALGLDGLTVFKRADFLNYKEDRKFDYIICLEVIEHIEDDKKALKKMFNLLKPSGKLIISIPSKNAPLFKLGIAKSFDKRVGHLRRYTLEELEEKFEEVRFRILESYKKEGIIRNFLFLNPVAGKLIRFIRGPISDFVTFIDNISVRLLGESDLIVVGEKR